MLQIHQNHLLHLNCKYSDGLFAAITSVSIYDRDTSMVRTRIYGFAEGQLQVGDVAILVVKEVQALVSFLDTPETRTKLRSRHNSISIM